jgi:hypothetical protein
MKSWLLLEHPGAWSVDVLDRIVAERVPGGIQAVARLRARYGLRPLVIRRHLRPRQRPGVTGPPMAFLGSAGGPLERIDLASLDLADLERVARAASSGTENPGTGSPGTGNPGETRREPGSAEASPGGLAVEAPLLLVCTHGSKDLCCATLGRPIAAALAQSYPDQVWECTHLGGDRFAGNLLSLPDGHLYGQLDPASAVEAGAAAMSGQVLPALLRGRTSVPASAQVAEIAVRQETGLTGIYEVRTTGITAHTPTAGSSTAGSTAAGSIAGSIETRDHTVIVAAGPDNFEVEVERHPLGTSGMSRCAGTLRPTSFVVRSLRRLGAAG